MTRASAVGLGALVAGATFFARPAAAAEPGEAEGRAPSEARPALTGVAEQTAVEQIVERIRARRAGKERGPQYGPHRPRGPRARPSDRDRARAEPPAENAPGGVPYLEESLAAGLGTGDGKLIDDAIAGLRAAGRGEAELATALDRAELAAALDYPEMHERVRTDAWTLAAKARLGDASAVDTLREWALARLAPGGAGERFDRRSVSRIRSGAARRSEALPCLAYLKEEGIVEMAGAILREDTMGDPANPASRYLGGSMAATQLAGAVGILLDADREKGAADLLALLDGDDLSVGHRTHVLQAYLQTLKEDKEAAGELVPRYEKLVDALIAKGFDEKRMSPELMPLLAVIHRGLPPDENILAALERLRAAVPEKHKRWVDNYVKAYRRRLGIEPLPRPPRPLQPARPPTGGPGPF